MGDELSFDVLAAGLRRDSQDVNTFIEVLTSRLEATLPSLVTVKRAGLFGKDRPVRQLTVQFDRWQYQLTRDRGRLAPVRIKLVGGVGIKTEPVSLEEWIRGVAEELWNFAGHREDARAALEKFLLP
ncbi:MAG: hypothetical protein M0Z53_09685 [Thermaerobacter sp.]|nr:hypothetical protein [Thermaerobacter sp.]